MPILLFILALLVGWGLVLAGGVILSVGWGLVAAGLLLLAIIVWITPKVGVTATGANGEGA